MANICGKAVFSRQMWQKYRPKHALLLAKGANGQLSQKRDLDHFTLLKASVNPVKGNETVIVFLARF
jgi:hypothetical protein